MKFNSLVSGAVEPEESETVRHLECQSLAVSDYRQSYHLVVIVFKYIHC